MARDFQINGETLVQVKGSTSTGLQALTQLGLSADPISVFHVFHHRDIKLDAYGGDDGVPADVQWMLAEVFIGITLIHFDPAVLALCNQAAMGGGTAVAEGSMGRAGIRLGNNQARFAPGNLLLGLNLTSPQNNRPWRFWYAFLAAPPNEWKLGTEKSIVSTIWRAIPYTQDPYGGSASQPNTVFGTGAQAAIVYDRTLDT